MNKDFEKLFEEANKLFFNDDYDHAFQILTEIVEKNPKHFASYEKLAQIEATRNNYSKSVEYYKKYLKFNGNNPDIWNELGNTYFDMKDYANSIRAYKKTIKLEPEAYWAFYNIGLAVLESESNKNRGLEKSKEWFKKAIKINSDYYPALNEMGLYYYNKLDYRRAKDFFNRAVKSNPSYKYPYFNMAKLYKDNKQNDKAKYYFAKAIKADNQYTAAYNNLGIMYYEEDNFNGALYYYSKALSTNDSYKYAYYNIGLIFDSLGQYRKAYDAFGRALEIESSYELAYKERARLEANYKEQISKGEKLLEEELDPHHYKKFIKERDLKDTLLDTESNKANKNSLFSEKFGRNITKQAEEGKLFHIVGREKEINDVLETLFSLKKNNPLIIGKSGVGKTAIVEGIAQRIADGKVPEFFKNKQIIEVNMGNLVSGTTFRGDFEKRLKNIIEEIKNDENLILFIDEIHTVMGAGETTSGTLNAANILKPALARGELRCIGATTTEEYQKYFQKDSAFDRRFSKVFIEELDTMATNRILESFKPKLEEHYDITMSKSYINFIIDLADTEVKNRVFPDKAIDILERSFSRTALKGESKVHKDTIKAVVSEMIGVKFLGTDSEKIKFLSSMEKNLKLKVKGQDDAVSQVTELIKMTKHRLDMNPEKPDGVMLFAGPSGVGKTYLAKQIASYLYDSPDALITINMSEFTEQHSVSKLIGSPPGYVGHETTSFFGSKIIEHPSSILLLDEVEKAHAEVLKLFLQIFDEGKITDRLGRTIYFSNVTIIMTSNVGVASNIGFNQKIDKNQVRQKLTSYFPVEFINRIDELILFNPVEKETARTIIEKILIKKAKDNYKKRGVNLHFEDSFIDYILDKGYNRSQGVRNLERVFQKEVMNVVAKKIFSNPRLKQLYIGASNGESFSRTRK